MKAPYRTATILGVLLLIGFGFLGVLPGELGMIGAYPIFAAMLAIFLISINAILVLLAKMTRRWPKRLRKLIRLDRYDL